MIRNDRFAWKALAPGPRDTARAMAQENVEIVRRAYEALSRGDTEAGTRTCPRPLSTWRRERFLTPRVSLGDRRDAEFARWMLDEFDDARTEIHELTDAHDKVVACVTLRGRGRQSGVEVGWHVWHVWSLRTGRSSMARDSRIDPKPSQPPG